MPAGPFASSSGLPRAVATSGPWRGPHRWPEPAAGEVTPARPVPAGAGRADDEVLERALGAARSGDPEAFRVVWRTLNPPLLRYLRVRLRGDLPALSAEDVASETWLQVTRNLSGFRGGGEDFRRWLFTVARHRAVDAARAELRRPLVHRVITVGERVDAAGPSAEEGALDRMSLDRALAVVASLPPDQAEAVALRVIAGLDVAATARILGKSRGAVRVAAHRGLRSLAAHPWALQEAPARTTPWVRAAPAPRPAASQG